MKEVIFTLWFISFIVWCIYTIRTVNKQIKELQTQLQQKENIIKEVRELLKNDYFEDGSFTNQEKVFELLDKENK